MALVKRGTKGSPISAAEYDAVVGQVETNQEAVEVIQGQFVDSEVTLSFADLAAATAYWNLMDTASLTPSNNVEIYLQDVKQFYKWNSGETAKAVFSRNYFDVKNTFDNTDEVNPSTMKATADYLASETEATPTAGSIKPVQSGGVAESISKVNDKIEVLNKQILINSDLSTYTGNNTGDFTRALALPFLADGFIKNIEARIVTAGVIKFKTLRLQEGETLVFDVIEEFEITASSGVQTLDVESLEIPIKVGDILAWESSISVGRIGFKSEAEGSFYTMSGIASGTGNTFTLSTGINFGVNVNYYTDALEPKVIKNTSDIVTINNQIVNKEENIGNASVDTYTSFATSEYTRAIATPISLTGILKSINFNISTSAGTVPFRIYSDNGDGTFALKSTFTVVATVGENTVDLLDKKIEVEPTDILGWYQAGYGNFIGFKSQSQNVYGLSGEDASGSSITFTNSTSIGFGINFDVIEFSELNAKINALEEYNETNLPYNPFVNARRLLKPVSTIYRNALRGLTIPTDFDSSGTWSYTANGVQSPATGGWGTYLRYNKLLTIDEQKISFKIKVVDNTSIFSIGSMSDLGQGTLAEIDCTTDKLNLYEQLNSLGGTPSSIVSSLDITAPTVNRVYAFSIEKSRELYTVKWIDTVTQEEFKIEFDAVGKDPSCGKLFNDVGVVFRQGDILITDMLITSAMPKNPRIAVTGNSITDGDVVRLLTNGGYTKRWVGLLSEKLNYNTFIMARGGQNTTDFKNDKQSLFFDMVDKPDLIIYALGINDSVFSTWKTNFENFKAVCDGLGVEVVPITLFPRIGRETFCAAVTNYVLESGLRYVDWSKALTTNGDRTNRDATLFQADNLHPNILGNEVLYKQTLIDLTI